MNTKPFFTVAVISLSLLSAPAHAKKPSLIGKIVKRAAVGALAVGAASYALRSTATDKATSGGYPRVVTKNGMLGCQGRDNFDQIARYSQDPAAFKKAMVQGIASGICIVFNKGEKVWVVDQSLLANRFELRREGELVSYWTVTDAVR